MSGAIFTTKKTKTTVGLAKLGMRDDGRGCVGQMVHDGDTVTIDPFGNLGFRFLGVDAPEVSFELPKPVQGGDIGGPHEDSFIEIADPRWEALLSDPFSPTYEKIDGLQGGLREYLEARVGPGTAANHAELATAATASLRAEVTIDMADLGQDEESFKFFLAFASEIMDSYGRFLGYLNCDKAEDPRPDSYNERLLQQGKVTPYFIWPNLDPFRKQEFLVDAVPKPGEVAPAVASEEERDSFEKARIWVREARQAKLGVWRAEDPLRLLPFELRFLANRTTPPRWVIDLSAGDDKLLAPQLYHQVTNPEDRLFVPPEYVELFASKGWRRVDG